MKILNRKKEDKVKSLLKPTLKIIKNLNDKEFARWKKGTELLYNSIQSFDCVDGWGDDELNKIEKTLKKESKK